MKNFLRTYLPFHWAFWFMFSMIGAVIVFHLLVITEFIPYEYVWGGRLNSKADMLVFESISLITNLLIGWILLTKLKPETSYLSEKVATIILVGLAGLCVVNTIGNLFATSKWEQVIATPLTLVAAICCFK